VRDGEHGGDLELVDRQVGGHWTIESLVLVPKALLRSQWLGSNGRRGRHPFGCRRRDKAQLSSEDLLPQQTTLPCHHRVDVEKGHNQALSLNLTHFGQLNDQMPYDQWLQFPLQ